MKLLYLLPLIVLCSCSTTPFLQPDKALDKNFITECDYCLAKNTLRPIHARNIGSEVLPGRPTLMVTKQLTFKCVACRKAFTQESEPIAEPIRTKAILAK